MNLPDYFTIDPICFFPYDSGVAEETSRRMDWILIILIGIFTVVMAAHVILAWKTYK